MINPVIAYGEGKKEKKRKRIREREKERALVQERERERWIDAIGEEISNNLNKRRLFYV